MKNQNKNTVVSSQESACAAQTPSRFEHDAKSLHAMQLLSDSIREKILDAVDSALATEKAEPTILPRERKCTIGRMCCVAAGLNQCIIALEDMVRRYATADSDGKFYCDGNPELYDAILALDENGVFQIIDFDSECAEVHGYFVDDAIVLQTKKEEQK